MSSDSRVTGVVVSLKGEAPRVLQKCGNTRKGSEKLSVSSHAMTVALCVASRASPASRSSSANPQRAAGPTPTGVVSVKKSNHVRLGSGVSCKSAAS